MITIEGRSKLRKVIETIRNFGLPDERTQALLRDEPWIELGHTEESQLIRRTVEAAEDLRRKVGTI